MQLPQSLGETPASPPRGSEAVASPAGSPAGRAALPVPFAVKPSLRSNSDGSILASPETPSRSHSNPYPQSWGPPTSYATRSDKLIIVCRPQPQPLRATCHPTLACLQVMVGLPARGKSYICRRLSHYISFFYGAPCKVFNSSEYLAAAKRGDQPESFFDVDAQDGSSLRNEANDAALDDLVKWMKKVVPKPIKPDDDPLFSGDFGAVAFFDASNTSSERRRSILNRVMPTGAKVIFLESICRDENLVRRNIIASKVGMKNYKNVDADEAVCDFLKRIKPFESEYEEMHEDDLSWIKVIDAGREVALHDIRGFLPSRLAHFLMNLRLTRCPFYLSRHGQSVYNEQGKIGGDSLLTQHGEAYALKLAKWAAEEICKTPDGKDVPARLWTSSLQRTIRTSRHIPHPVIQGPNTTSKNDWIQMRPKVFRNLDEIYAGVCDGMTYEEIAEAYPEEAASRKHDKFAYRYPRGESYIDLIARLEPIALEMERQTEPLLIVGHQAIHRVLYAYLMGFPREQCVDVSIPLNTVIMLTPTESGCEEARFTLIQHPPGTSLDPASH